MLTLQADYPQARRYPTAFQIVTCMFNLRRAVRCGGAAYLLCMAWWFSQADRAFGNAIQDENALPGTTSWQLTNPATNREIEGYASVTSVNQGKKISLFVNTADANYAIDVAVRQEGAT